MQGNGNFIFEKEEIVNPKPWREGAPLDELARGSMNWWSIYRPGQDPVSMCRTEGCRGLWIPPDTMSGWGGMGGTRRVCCPGIQDACKGTKGSWKRSEVDPEWEQNQTHTSAVSWKTTKSSYFLSKRKWLPDMWVLFIPLYYQGTFQTSGGILSKVGEKVCS